MNKKHAGRVLAVDLRARRLGYAVFETPHRLLDVGTSRFDSATQAQDRVQALLKNFRPGALVLDAGTTRGPRNNRRAASITKLIRKHAKTSTVSLVVIRARTLRTFFASHRVRNKYAFAAVSARWFPQLAWRVPPKRKCYESEPSIMIAFDAVALGTACLRQHNHDAAEFFRRSLSDE